MISYTVQYSEMEITVYENISRYSTATDIPSLADTYLVMCHVENTIEPWFVVGDVGFAELKRYYRDLGYNGITGHIIKLVGRPKFREF